MSGERESPTGLASVTAGAFAGACNIVAGFPFDTVKVAIPPRLVPDHSRLAVPEHALAPFVQVRLQNSRPGMYKGPWDCFMTIWRKEGASSIFRGMSPSLAGGALETGAASCACNRDAVAASAFVPMATSRTSS